MPTPKPATKAGNNILSKEETVSICTHLAKAIENICGSITSLPKAEIAILAEKLESTAVMLRGFCRNEPEASSEEWAKTLDETLTADAKTARVFRQHMEEIQVAVDRGVIRNTLAGKRLDKTETIIAKARAAIVDEIKSGS